MNDRFRTMNSDMDLAFRIALMLIWNALFWGWRRTVTLLDSACYRARTLP